jgi:leucyl-tRNA synthetase
LAWTSRSPGLFTQGMVVHETYKRHAEGSGFAGRVRSKATAKAPGDAASDRRPVEIGSIEKMSKSKKNVVDPDDIIASYGADTRAGSCCRTRRPSAT